MASYFDAAVEFAQFSAQQTDIADLTKGYLQSASLVGVSAVSVAVVRTTDGKQIIGNPFGKADPEWGQVYMDHNNGLHDPIVNRSIGSTRYGFWWHIIGDDKLTKAEERVLDDAKQFGFLDGHTTPVSLFNSQVATVTAMGEKLDHSPEGDVTLWTLSSHYAAEGYRILNTPPTTAFLKKPSQLLTPTALKVFEYKIQGRKTMEIAAAMGSSARTVERHIKEATTKLNATNTVEAVAKLFKLGVLR